MKKENMTKHIALDDLKEDFEILRSQDLFLNHVNRFDYFLQQIESEWVGLMDVVGQHQIKYGMEIGTWGGGTFSTLTHLADDDATLLSLDLHEGMYKDLDMKEKGLKMLKKHDQTICVLNYDSHEQKSVCWVESILGENKLDYLFIDGDHSYDGVRDDFNMYSYFVKDNGIICFHDIQPHTKGAEVDVFWKEIKDNYKHQEIIEDINQTWAGIGILWK